MAVEYSEVFSEIEVEEVPRWEDPLAVVVTI